MKRYTAAQDEAMRWAGAHGGVVIAHTSTERSLVRRGIAEWTPGGALVLTEVGTLEARKLLRQS